MSEVKYHELDLPSKLIPYKADGVTKVEIRMTRGKDIKLIGEFNTDNFEKKFKLLLSNILKGIDPGKLTIGDRLYIAIWLAINCESNLFPIDLFCETCLRTIKKYNIVLNTLGKVYLPEDFKEPYPVKLLSGETVNIRLYRVNDQIQYMDYIRAKNDEEDLLFKLAQTIVDDKDIIKRIEWLNEQETKDIGLMRAVHEKYFHGVDMDNAPYKCPKCGGTGKTPVPFRLDLLLPNGSLIAGSLGRNV